DIERTAGGEAELIPLEFGLRDIVLVIKEVVCVQDTVANELECAAVKFVGARFRDRVDCVTGTPTILGRERVGLNLEFLQLIDGRRINNYIPVTDCVPVAIQQK